MKTWLPLFLALLTLGCAGGIRDPHRPRDFPAAALEAENTAFQILRAGGSSLGIALVAREGTVFASGYGSADLALGTPAIGSTLFPIGSVSKMFAAVAVLQLVDQGLIDLEKPVAFYLPAFRMADPRYAGISVRMLLNHSSGIPGTLYTSAETSAPVPGYAAAVLAALADQRLKADPGEFSVYCNDGWTLCDPLVAAVARIPYREYVQQKIFTPLGMRSSTFSLAPLAAGSFARAYQNGAVLPQEYINVDAAGGIWSTPGDMAAFARMFLTEGLAADGTRVLSRESIARMAVDQTTGTFNPVPTRFMAFGLGWDTVTEAGLHAAGIRAWTKNGGTFYYGAQVLVVPEAGLATVSMAPAGGGFSPLGVAQRVMLRALVEDGRLPAFPAPLPARAAPEATPPAGLVESVAGIYGNFAHAFQLRAEPDGGLTMLTLGAGGFVPGAVLRYRADGWFTADADPLTSYRVVAGGADAYLAVRSPDASKSSLDTQAFAQRLKGRGAGLSAAWSARLGRRWLVVNECPEGLPWLAGEDPRFGLLALPALPGLVFALPALPPMGMGLQAQALDASGSDASAAMLLRLPGYQGTDMNGLDVVVRGGEEWLRWGGYLHRPLETVPVLPAGATSTVGIGPEGYAEWRSVPLRTAPATLGLAGARAWRLFDANFQGLGSGSAGSAPRLPAGSGTAYLLLFGSAGGAVSVTVP